MGLYGNESCRHEFAYIYNQHSRMCWQPKIGHPIDRSNARPFGKNLNQIIHDDTIIKLDWKNDSLLYVILIYIYIILNWFKRGVVVQGRIVTELANNNSFYLHFFFEHLFCAFCIVLFTRKFGYNRGRKKSCTRPELGTRQISSFCGSTCSHRLWQKIASRCASVYKWQPAV